MHRWKQQRNYQPGAKLYARRSLKFDNKVIEPGEELPPMSAKDHLMLWRVGHADHAPQSPFVAAPAPAKKSSQPRR